MEQLIQPVVNLIGLAALVAVLSTVPLMMSALILKQLWWWGLGDAE